MRKVKLLATTILALVAHVSYAEHRTFAPPDQERVVRAAYAKLTQLAAAGGEQLVFTLGDFRHVPADEFGSVRWVDVVTPPGGDMIDVARTVKAWNGEEQAVLYRPSWKLDGEAYVKSAEGRDLLRMAVDEVVAARAATEPEVGRVDGLTSYQVEVTLDGRSRIYRAALLWLPAGAGRDAGVFVLDHVTQGVGRAARERRIEPRPRAQAPLAARPRAGLRCEASDWAVATSQFSDKGTNGHLGYAGMAYGYHQAYARLAHRCTCDASCTAFCATNFTESACWDSGEPIVCHAMAQDAKEGSSDSQDGSTSAPKCSAGFGCAQRSCAFCWCDASITVKIDPYGSVTFGNHGSTEWSAELKWENLQCAPCTRLPDDPGDGGGDPGGPDNQGDGEWPGGPGGGSVGGCCWWNTSCHYNSFGQWVCAPSTCGQYGC